MIKWKEMLKLSTEMVIPMMEVGKITKNMEKEDMISKRDRKFTRENGFMTQRKENSLRPETKMDLSSRVITLTMRKMVSSHSLILKQEKLPGKKNGKMVSSHIKNDHTKNIFSYLTICINILHHLNLTPFQPLSSFANEFNSYFFQVLVSTCPNLPLLLQVPLLSHFSTVSLLLYFWLFIQQPSN